MNDTFVLSPAEMERAKVANELRKYVETNATRFLWGEIDEKELMKRLKFYRARWLKDGLGI